MNSDDIKKWYSSSHARKKADWICIDQPKVINEWKDKFNIQHVFYNESLKRPEWAMENYSSSCKESWIKDVTKKPSPPDYIVIFKRPTYSVSDLLITKKALVIDKIQDPGNLGTIIRSASAFGVNTLCLTDNCVDPFHPKCVSASSGHIATINIFYEKHWKDWIKSSKIPSFILNPYTNKTLQSINPTDSFILICGSEGTGIQSKHIKPIETTQIKIPMTTNCDSLNAGVSVSIALYHFQIGTK